MTTAVTVVSKVRAKFGSVADSLTNKYQVSIAKEGERHEPVVGVAWVRVKLLPAETELLTVGPNPIEEISGLCQFDIFTSGARGLDLADVVAQDLIDSLSSQLLELDGVDGRLVTEAVWVEANREEPTWIQTPLFVRWRICTT